MRYRGYGLSWYCLSRALRELVVQFRVPQDAHEELLKWSYSTSQCPRDSGDVGCPAHSLSGTAWTTGSATFSSCSQRPLSADGSLHGVPLIREDDFACEHWRFPCWDNITVCGVVNKLRVGLLADV